jgi:hypothetical protein
MGFFAHEVDLIVVKFNAGAGRIIVQFFKIEEFNFHKRVLTLNGSFCKMVTQW